MLEAPVGKPRCIRRCHAGVPLPSPTFVPDLIEPDLTRPYCHLSIASSSSGHPGHMLWLDEQFGDIYQPAGGSIIHFTRPLSAGVDDRPVRQPCGTSPAGSHCA